MEHMRDSGRWTASDKERLLREIDTGLLTNVEAMERYEISAEELTNWQRAFAERGLEALKARKPRVPARIARYRGMVWVASRLKKPAKCWISGQILPKGEIAWRPLTNNNSRMRRIALDQLEAATR
jgi:hypothetical protein